MRIVICVNSFHPLIGGSEIVTKKIAEYLSSRGHDVFVVTRRNKHRRNNKIKKVRIVEYQPGDWTIFQAKLIELNPDLVLVYSDVFDFFRQIITNQNKFRLMIALCGANWAYSHKNFANILFRSMFRIEKIICHSTVDRDYKLCSNPMMLPKTIVIPNGVDLLEFDSNKLTRDDLLPEHKYKRWLLNVSNFFPGKGQTHIIDILNKFNPQEEIIYIQVCSDIDFKIGEQLEILWKKQIGLNLHKNVKSILKKNIPREEIIGYFKNSNAFVFPSEKEVAPICILESMAASLPWIAADVGNIKDLKGGKIALTVKDTRNHSLFDARVKNIFASHLKEVLSTPVIGEDGRRQIETQLNWDKILPQYASIIET